jgi:hypothetical protein
MAALPRQTQVELAAEEGRKSRCLFIPPQALPGIDLPARLLLEGPEGSQVVGWSWEPGASDETVVLTSPAICHSVSGDACNQPYVAVRISKARVRDVIRHIEATTILKLTGAAAAAAGAIISGVIGILESSVSFGAIALLLFLVVLGAGFSGYFSVRDAIDVDCDSG